MADLVAVMRDGAAAARLAEEIYERPANRFVALFVGSPPMNCRAPRSTMPACMSPA